MAALSVAAVATTHSVSPDGSGDFPTIQAAINAAAPGDTVELTVGTFTGTGNRDLNYWGKAITVCSAGGDPEHTVVHGTASYRGVSFTNGEGAGSVLEGIGVWSGDGDFGGGIKCVGASPTITNCSFYGCTAGIDGAALHCVDSSPSLTDCSFSHNFAMQYGGGVYCDSLSAPSFVSCFFGANAASRGAGVVCDGGDLVLDDCRFEGNIASVSGAGVYCRNGAAASMNLCRFKWNDATDNGGGVYVTGGASASLTACTFTENDAEKGAGLLLSSPLTVTLVDCDFDLNTAQLGGGGVYSYMADSTSTFTGCSFDENSSGVSGGAMHLRGSSPRLTNCDFVSNTTASGSGGGLYCRDGSGPLLDGCFFDDNETPLQGGAVYASGATLDMIGCGFFTNRATADGGGIYSTGTRVTLYGCSFLANSSQMSGGGVAMVSADSSAVESCIFGSNLSMSDGGAVACYETRWVALENCTFHQNEVMGRGGIALLTSSEVTLENSIVSDTKYAEGVYCDATSDATVLCCDVYGNDEGDWVGCLLSQQYVNGNLCTDPLYCSTSLGDVSIAWESECSGLTGSGCGLIGASGPGCGIHVSSICDVVNDQGRRVYVTWDAAYNDRQAATDPVTGYTLWRRIDARQRQEEILAVEEGVLGAGDRFPPGDWCYVGEVPAFCEDAYTTSCETVCDSTIAEGMCWSIFFVRAGTDVPATYFDSVPDSGYSVDNLEPEVPSGLLADGDETLVVLSWDPNSDADLDYYAVYRDTIEDFVPGTPIGYTVTESHEDADPPDASEWWYRVTAWDFAGNESDASESARVVRTGIAGDMPSRFWLGPAVPNPFNATTAIHYRVPEGASDRGVELVIHDASGRLVRTLLDHQIVPGAHATVWDGRDSSGSLVASGIYFYSMKAGDYSSREKLLLLK